MRRLIAGDAGGLFVTSAADLLFREEKRFNHVAKDLQEVIILSELTQPRRKRF